MLRFLLLYFLLTPKLLFPQLTPGETVKVDSLKDIIAMSEHDTLKIKALNEWESIVALNDAYLDADINEQILDLCNTNLLSEENLLNDDEIVFYRKAKAEALSELGFAYSETGQYPFAFEHYDKALKAFEDLGNKERKAKTLNDIGYLYVETGDYKQAMDYYMQSLKLNEELGIEESISLTLCNIGFINFRFQDYETAMDYYQRSLAIDEKIDNKRGIARTSNYIAFVLAEQKKFDEAKAYINKALEMFKEIGRKRSVAASLDQLGAISRDEGKYREALKFHRQGLAINTEIDSKDGRMYSLNYIARVYDLTKQYSKAIQYNEQAYRLAMDVGIMDAVKNIAYQLYIHYKEVRRNGKALDMYEQYIAIRDSLEGVSIQKDIIKQEYQYEYDKRALADSLKHAKEQVVVEVQLEKEEQKSNFLFLGMGLAVLFGGFIYNRFMVTSQRKKIIESQKFELEDQKSQSEKLLLNILPKKAADELIEKGDVSARFYPMATVIHTDFIGFSEISGKLEPHKLVEELHRCFSAFDEIIEKYGIEKIKTIGDAYLAVSGIPVSSKSHAEDALLAALEIKSFMTQHHQKEGVSLFEIRIGIHSGPLVAGVVGKNKFQYDVWGDTVIVSNIMESKGHSGEVNISEDTYQLLKNDPRFTFKERGEQELKFRGKMKMYFAEANS